VNNSEHQILKHFAEVENQTDWVLATLIKKIGSGYRRSGAMMLIGPLGERLGLISGGCLEKDIVHKAQRIAATKCPEIIEYNSLDDDYEAALFNTGCEGKLFVYLEPVTSHHIEAFNHAQALLDTGKHCYILQGIEIKTKSASQIALLDESLRVHYQSDEFFSLSALQLDEIKKNKDFRQQLLEQDRLSLTRLVPDKHLFIVGGGPDAIALCYLASGLGWRVRLWDDRSNFTRDDEFSSVEQIDRRDFDEIDNFEWLQQYDAVVLKSHNLQRDSQWLQQIKNSHPHVAYIGMLGPKKRREKVIATVSDQNGLESKWFDGRLFSPAGIDVGGELPESVALSILSQCHAVLYNKL